MPMLNLEDGCRLHYSVSGKGTPIVLIHPPVITSVIFTYQIEALSEDFQIITFDIRGHGQSDSSDRPISYPLIVEDIHKLLNHLQIQEAYIGGYSTGGSIALEFLLTYPDRALGGILISSMPNVNDDYLRNKIGVGIKLAEAGAKGFLAWTISFSNSDTKNIFQKMFNEARKGDIHNIAQYFRCSQQYNCTGKLTEISLPVLLVYGNKDTSFHQYAKLLHEKLPNNELKFIQENHRIPTKSAPELNERMRQFCTKWDKRNV